MSSTSQRNVFLSVFHSFHSIHYLCTPIIKKVKNQLCLNGESSCGVHLAHRYVFIFLHFFFLSPFTHYPQHWLKRISSYGLLAMFFFILLHQFQHFADRNCFIWKRKIRIYKFKCVVTKLCQNNYPILVKV